MISDKLTKAANDVKAYLKEHSQHISSHQRRVLKRRSKKLKQAIEATRQKAKQDFQITHQLNLKL